MCFVGVRVWRWLILSASLWKVPALKSSFPSILHWSIPDLANLACSSYWSPELVSIGARGVVSSFRGLGYDYMSTCLPAGLSTYLPIYLSSIHPSTHPQIHISVEHLGNIKRRKKNIKTGHGATSFILSFLFLFLFNCIILQVSLMGVNLLIISPLLSLVTFLMAA